MKQKSDLIRKKEELSTILGKANNVLSNMSKVTKKTFYDALRKKAINKEIEEYVLGVFAPWQAMPDWFNELIKVEGK